MSLPGEFRVRRVYDDNHDEATYRVLIDRLWPRGITRTDAALDEWLKDVAPSTELRRWYHHDTDKFTEFSRRYRAELRRRPASAGITRLTELARAQPVTLLTATRDVEHSAATVLHNHLTSRAFRSRRRAVSHTAEPRGDDRVGASERKRRRSRNERTQP